MNSSKGCPLHDVRLRLRLQVELDRCSLCLTLSVCLLQSVTSLCLQACDANRTSLMPLL